MKLYFSNQVIASIILPISLNCLAYSSRTLQGFKHRRYSLQNNENELDLNKYDKVVPNDSNGFTFEFNIN